MSKPTQAQKDRVFRAAMRWFNGLLDPCALPGCKCAECSLIRTCAAALAARGEKQEHADERE